MQAEDHVKGGSCIQLATCLARKCQSALCLSQGERVSFQSCLLLITNEPFSFFFRWLYINCVNFQQIKQDENEAAVRMLPSRLNELDSLEGCERQKELVVGLVAGNFFDWGAREVVK